MPVHDPAVPTEVEDLVTALPKVELHVHLEGSMPPELLLDLAVEHGVDGLPSTVEAVREWYEFRDFDHFATVYETALSVLRDEDDFAALVEQTAATLAAQNVRYAEVILTPHAHITRGVPAPALFTGVERGRIAARQAHGIELRWVPDFPGHWGAESGEITLDAVLGAGLDSVVGFSVGGIEVDRGPFADVFGRARAAGLHSIPHAGESAGPDRVWSAVRQLGAERIGHGIRCLDDPSLVDHLVDLQLPLDVCPTSNLRTRAVTSPDEHPLPRMLEAGLLVTLNSDDPPMFDTDLVNEYRAAHRMGLPPATLVQLARNGVRCSFADEEAKTAILADIDRVAGRFTAAGA